KRPQRPAVDAPQVVAALEVPPELRDVAPEETQVSVLVRSRDPGERLDGAAAHEPPRSPEAVHQVGDLGRGQGAPWPVEPFPVLRLGRVPELLGHGAMLAGASHSPCRMTRTGTRSWPVTTRSAELPGDSAAAFGSSPIAAAGDAVAAVTAETRSMPASTQ